MNALNMTYLILAQHPRSNTLGTTLSVVHSDIHIKRRTGIFKSLNEVGFDVDLQKSLVRQMSELIIYRSISLLFQRVKN